MAGPSVEPDQLERQVDALLPVGPGEPRQEERQLHVLERRQDGNQIVELEDEPDVPRPPGGELRVFQGAERLARDPHVAARGLVDAPDQVQERRLSGAAGSHERQEFSPLHLEVDPGQHRDFDLVPAVDLVDVVERDQAAVRCGDAVGHSMFLRFPI